MKYIVDPQLIRDALEGESEPAKAATALFEAHRADELVLAPTSYLALGPSFMGIQSMQDRFLDTLGVKVAKDAPAKVMDAAYSAWSNYQKDHPAATGGMSVFDQLYIGAYALLFDGILTRNGALYRTYFESLNVVDA